MRYDPNRVITSYAIDAIDYLKCKRWMCDDGRGYEFVVPGIRHQLTHSKLIPS